MVTASGLTALMRYGAISMAAACTNASTAPLAMDAAAPAGMG
jgi:hypothetical protein